MKKTYEINGVMTYAHVIGFEVEAKSYTEARQIAKEKTDSLIDPAMAEFQECIFDKPILIQSAPLSKTT